MISISGSLSFAKLVMMSSAPAKSAGDARYASQDPFIQPTFSHTISTPICIRRRVRSFYIERNKCIVYSYIFSFLQVTSLFIDCSSINT